MANFLVRNNDPNIFKIIVIAQIDRGHATKPVTYIVLHAPISQGFQKDNSKLEYSQLLELLINRCTI